MIGFVKGLKASMFVPPVGYIWKSASAVSPASIYEGTTWAQIKDRAILAAGTSYENGTTGGSASEQLAVSIFRAMHTPAVFPRDHRIRTADTSRRLPLHMGSAARCHEVTILQLTIND